MFKKFHLISPPHWFCEVFFNVCIFCGVCLCWREVIKEEKKGFIYKVRVHGSRKGGGLKAKHSSTFKAENTDHPIPLIHNHLHLEHVPRMKRVGDMILPRAEEVLPDLWQMPRLALIFVKRDIILRRLITGQGCYP
jgi:hypothetical protein